MASESDVPPAAHLTILAKAPVAGTVKTRLCPPLTSEEAARLAEAFLLDEVTSFQTLPSVTLTVAYAPLDAESRFQRLFADNPVDLVPQQGTDLGERLLHVFISAPAGIPQAVIGSDSPDLPPILIQFAFARLRNKTCDVVLGPTPDGGYYLLAARAPHPELFHNIPWSTSAVLETTRQRAEAAGLHVELLPPWEDVDTPEDLSRLHSRLAATPSATSLRTRAVLSALWL